MLVKGMGLPMSLWYVCYLPQRKEETFDIEHDGRPSDSTISTQRLFNFHDLDSFLECMTRPTDLVHERLRCSCSELKNTNSPTTSPDSACSGFRFQRFVN